MPAAGKSATDGATSPNHEQDTHEALSAPVSSQMSTGNLQEKVTEEENARNRTGLHAIHAEIAAHGWKSQRNIRSIDKSDRIHDRSYRNNPQPPFLSH